MTLLIRMRGLAAWLCIAVALAAPLAAFAQDDDDAAADDEQSAEADAGDDDSAAADDEGEEAEEEEGGEEDWTLTHHGLYLMGEGSYDILTQKSDLEDTAEDAGDFGGVDVNSKTNDSWGYGGRIGWRLSDRLAFEGQFALLNNIEIKQHVQAGADVESKAEFLTATGNVKAFLLTQRFQPYGLFGAGYGHSTIEAHEATDDRSDGFVMRFGVGSDFYITDNLGLMGEAAYVLPTGDISDFDHVAIHFGAFLRFHGGS